MYLSCLQQLFLLLSFIGGCSCRNVYVIGIMTSVHTEPDCKTINPDRIKMIEAAYWLIDVLNNNSEQNISFEIQTMDICEHLSAVPATLALIDQYRNGPKRLIGIVTHSTSANVMMISQIINSLPEEYRIIQMGVAATAIELNNRLKYPNVFRVLPDDRTQMKMICNILVQIQWNYIALLYEDDVYGRQGAELFSRCAKEANIHIRAKLAINTKNLDQIKYNLLKVSGMLIIAQLATVKRFFEKDRFGRKMSYMMSETTTMHISLLQVHGNGAFLIVQKPYFKNQKFEHYWKNLFKQTPGNITTKNPFFQKMIEEVLQCSFMDYNNSCDMENALKLITSKMSEFYSTESLVTGLYAITSNLGMILENSCSSDPDCPGLFKEGIKAFQKPTNYVFLKNEMGYERMNIVTTFNANGTLENPPGWILYQLYYRKFNKITGKFSFIKIGNYSPNGLKLTTNIIPGYDLYGNPIWVTSVTCQPGLNCKDYQKTPGYIYKKGDILFVGIVPIHTRDSSQSYSCGKIRTVSGVSLAEAMLFAIKELNERRTYKNIFPGKKIGILILDTCSSDIIILRKLFALQRDDTVICGTHLNCSEIRNKTIVYIGALLSQVSLAVSKIMTAQNRVQISFGSTSNRLSDREAHPNFLRICTSDDEQVKAIIDLLMKFSWKYISIIYKDDLYGNSFKESFLDKSEEHDICVIRAIPYTEDFAAILTKLRQRPEAQVIVLFIGSNQINTFLQGFTEIMLDNEFTFIGSEAWSNKILLDEKVAKKIEGSITLGLEIQENADFIEYTKEKILKENGMNEWLQNYMELTCYLPLSLNKISNIPCPFNYTLYQLDMKSVWIPFVIDAINVAAIGLNQSITQTCSNGLVCPKLFEKIGQLIQNIKNVQLTKTNGKFRMFNDNGDGIINYIIYKLEFNGMYTKVGHWSNAESIVFNSVFKPPVGPTKCPNRKHCSECLYVKKNEQIYKKVETEESYVAVLVVFILLLLLLITIVIVIGCCARKIHPKQVRNQPEGGGNSEPYSHSNNEISMDDKSEDVIPKVIDDGH